MEVNHINFRMKNILICFLFLICSTSFMPESKWVKLIDSDLSQWNMYVSFKLTDGYKGDAPVDADGKLLVPVQADDQGHVCFR